jgi:hypothetical protein
MKGPMNELIVATINAARLSDLGASSGIV